METEAPYFTWRRTSGAAPDAVKAARPVLNGGREETCRKVTRLAPTQRRGGGDQTGHLRIKRATGRPLRQGLRFQESARRALCARRWAVGQQTIWQGATSDYCPCHDGRRMGPRGRVGL